MKAQPNTVNERLRELRGELSITQFAQLLGVHYNTISNYEKGRRPELAFLIKACELLRCDLDWLVFGKRVKVDAGVGEPSAANIRSISKGSAIEDVDIPLFVEVVQVTGKRLGKRTTTTHRARFSELVRKGFLGLKLYGASGSKLPAAKTTQWFLDAAEQIELETAAEKA